MTIYNFHLEIVNELLYTNFFCHKNVVEEAILN